MAEEQNAEQEEEKKPSPLIKYGVLLGIVVVVPVALAFAAFSLFLKPALDPEDPVDPGPDVIDPFPATMVEIIFDEQQISVQTEDPEMVAPLLLVQVMLTCRDAETAALVDLRKSLFSAMILRMHRGRTRTELNDTLVENSILEQIKQQSNILLKRLDPEADLMVLDALHLKYTIVDL